MSRQKADEVVNDSTDSLPLTASISDGPTDEDITSTPPTDCANVFKVTELCERILDGLSQYEIIRCMRVSRAFNDTIRGSIALQRHIFLLPDDTITVAKAIRREAYVYAKVHQVTEHGLRYDPEGGPIARINPLVFEVTGKTHSLQWFPVRERLQQMISDPIAEPGRMGDMFITQPAVESVRILCKYNAAGTNELRGSSSWKMDGRGGIRVKDLIAIVRESLTKEAWIFKDDEGCDLEHRLSILLGGR